MTMASEAEENKVIKKNRGESVTSFIEKFAKEIGDSTGANVKIIDPAHIEGSMNILKKIPQIKDNFSDEDLRKEVSGFLSELHGIPIKNDDDLAKRTDEFIKNITEGTDCEAILMLDSVYDLPIGKKFGNLEIIEKDTSYEGMEKYAKQWEVQLRSAKSCSWAKLKFKTYKPGRFWEDFMKEIEKPLSIISFILQKEIDSNDILGIIYCRGKTVKLSKIERFVGFVRYRSDIFGSYIDEISSIYNKEKPSQLEIKLMNAIEMFWMSKISHKLEISFVLMASAMETLIMSESDKDYLSWKLAEKTAFLLTEEGGKRKELYKSMKKLYNKRSKFVHEGIKNIDRRDLGFLGAVFFETSINIINLIINGFKYADELNDYIEEIKFSS